MWRHAFGYFGGKMNFPLFGALVNTGTVILGSLVGLLLRRGLSKKIGDSVMLAMSLCVGWIGITGAIKGTNTIVIIISTLIGALIGEAVDIDRYVSRLGEAIEKKVGTRHGSVAQGFVSATLLFCVGSMTVLGALESGLSGNHTTQLAKSLLDFVSSMIYASSLGIGVMFAAGSVLLIQGSITLLAGLIEPLLSEAVITEMTAVGSIFIVGLALNMMGVTKFKLMNYIPAIFLPILLCPLYELIVGLF